MNMKSVTAAGSPHPNLGVGAGGRRLFGLSKAAQAVLEPQASAPAGEATVFKVK